MTSPTGFILLLKSPSKCTARLAVVPMFWSPTALLTGSLAASNSGAAGRRIFFVVDGRLSEGKYVDEPQAGFVYIVPLFRPSIRRGCAVHVIRGSEEFGEVFVFLLADVLCNDPWRSCAKTQNLPKAVGGT